MMKRNLNVSRWDEKEPVELVTIKIQKLIKLPTDSPLQVLIITLLLLPRKLQVFFIRTGSQQNEVILFFCLYSNFNFFISLSQEDCQFNITLLTCRISTKRFRDLIVMKSMLYYLLFMNGYSSAACLLKYD